MVQQSTCKLITNKYSAKSLPSPSLPLLLSLFREPYLQPLLLLPLPFPCARRLLVHAPLVLLCLRYALGVRGVLVSVEVSATVHAREDLAPRTLILVVFLHLVLLERSATRVTREEHHHHTLEWERKYGIGNQNMHFTPDCACEVCSEVKRV